ncbi:MAG: M13 family metallopeptidase, partial [Candidatus Eisenbacteria bacterium]
MKRYLVPILALALTTAAASSTTPTSDVEHYLGLFIDPATSPRDDFFTYAVGKWLHENPIPPNERSWGIAHVVQEETYQRLLSINEEASSNPGSAPGSIPQKIGDFWHASMDTVTIAQQGMTPLADEFARIQAVKDTPGLLDDIAHLQYIGVGAMYGLALFQDEKNSDRYAVHLYQGGLGMPDRDYYFDTDDRSKMLRREYVVHVAKMFALLGEDSTIARKDAGVVMRLETELAGASRKLADLRDPIANYHAMPIDGVSKLTPSIRWRQFLDQGNIHGVDTVIVGQPEFLQQVEKSLHGHPLAEWKTYLRWSLMNTYASQAGGPIDDENFHFYGTILNGTPEQRPRWKRSLDEEENYLGDALGQLYVQRYFSPRTKERYTKLTNEIFTAFQSRIRNLDWMSEVTKQRALHKLEAVTKKVGYPDHWRDYSTYDVQRGSFLVNCVRGNVWRSEFYIKKLNKPVDRTEWDMTPQTYNAYYNPSNNEIVLPAAAFILPGIADSLVDDAIVYSYAGGSTIGHEITHGFDDQGRQFDEHGNLEDWWTPTDVKEFNARAARIVRQYDGYVAVGDMHVNGSATQGENIADLGGITLGWDAFTKTEQYKRGQAIGGLTPAQRYFMGWALSWMNQIRPENLAVRVKTDVHAPSFLRVIGPVSNLPEFYQAFGVKPG